MNKLFAGLLVALSLFVAYTIYTPNYLYMQRSTVLLEVHDKNGNVVGHGSGVILPGGYILTAGHMTINDYEVVARFRQGETSSTHLVDMEYERGRGKILTDISLLKVEDTYNYPSVSISCETQPVGTSLYIVGNPANNRWATTRGNVMATVPRAGYKQGSWIQIDGTVWRGQSGGAIFNRQGQLVGVVSHGLTARGGPTGLNYGVSGPAICEFLEGKWETYSPVLS